MGHCLGKLPVTNINGTNTTNVINIANNKNINSENSYSLSTSIVPSNNWEIEEYSSSNLNRLNNSHSSSLSSINTIIPRQIVIKIQLAKMDNENERKFQKLQTKGKFQQYVSSSENHQNRCNNNDNNDKRDSTHYTDLSDRNSNQIEKVEKNLQMINVPRHCNLNSNEISNSSEASYDVTTTKTLSERTNRTAGGSTLATTLNNHFNGNIAEANLSHNMNNHNNKNIKSNNNTLVQRVSALQVNSNDKTEQNTISLETIELPEYYEILEENASSIEQLPYLSKTSNTDEYTCGQDTDSESKYCSRRKVKSVLNSATTSTKLSKRRCRDAFKRILDSSSSKNNKNKDRKEQRHFNNIDKETKLTTGYLPHQQQKCCPSITTSTLNNSTPNSIFATSSSGSSTMSSPSQVSIWSSNRNDVIIPINSPQVVVVQCPPTSLVTLRRIDENAISVMTSEIVAGNNENADNAATISTNASQQFNTLVKNAQIGPIVHSQIDFMHCLVPDLKEITKSSFYMGKMDRYEAERLLEGKPEGTFLLRDSAQEEFLFSVTFRKYGRSLHARIEQNGHKFSFDCHDPCVFASNTVTGLLEHYKDPACVMFFEPMLTHPLHRSNPFSLQQLCRATIVSNTTYDGINALEMPMRLKSYLKEYHYKQKLRVKPIEPFYTCT